MDIPAGEFKAKCLQLMDRVARTREPIVITKRGRPVAKLVPPDEPRARGPLFGYMAGSANILGDLMESAPLEWAAATGEEDDLYAEAEAGSPAEVREPSRRSRRR